MVHITTVQIRIVKSVAKYELEVVKEEQLKEVEMTKTEFYKYVREILSIYDKQIKLKFGTKILWIIDSRNDLPLEKIVFPEKWKKDFLAYASKNNRARH